MTLYSKHTNGEAYTLNGDDYIGFFHIEDGVVYSERYPNDERVELIPKNTFISQLYTNMGEMDTIYKNISSITPCYSNVFDLLNKQGLDTTFGAINHNNLICFKNLILANPTIYKFEENSGHFYSLSSNSDVPSGKTERTHIIPFSDDEVWGFMDEITTGTFLVDSDNNFKYLCSTGTHNYVLSGSFSDNSPLAIVSEVNQHPWFGTTPDYTYNIHNDEENDRLLYVNNDNINIYDSSNYEECDNLILVDRIALNATTTTDYIWNKVHVKWNSLKIKWSTRFSTLNTNNPQFIKFGKNLRTSISNNKLYLLNKYSSDVYQIINVSDLGEILDLDIRNTDDNIIILNRKNSKYYIYFIDPTNTSNAYNIEIYNVDETSMKYSIKFSNIDSNVFYLSTRKQFQSRFISNPTYPSGRMETSELYYSENMKWKDVAQKWKYYKIPWNSFKLESNSYNNLLVSEISKNDNMYLLLHNVGRLYSVKQPMNDRFLNAIPLDTVKYYNGTVCSESSFGLYFNSVISNLIKDTLNLFNQSTGSFSIKESEILSKQLEDVILETENLYINGNETPNIVTIQRIFSTIVDIQSILLPESVEI